MGHLHHLATPKMAFAAMILLHYGKGLWLQGCIMGHLHHLATPKMAFAATILLHYGKGFVVAKVYHGTPLWCTCPPGV